VLTAVTVAALATDLRRASSHVSRIILRLHAMGGLAARANDESHIKLARETLANPGLNKRAAPVVVRRRSTGRSAPDAR
jgi:hypothetical protein